MVKRARSHSVLTDLCLIFFFYLDQAIMKVFIILAALVAATCAHLLTDAEIKPQWEEFKVTIIEIRQIRFPIRQTVFLHCMVKLLNI